MKLLRFVDYLTEDVVADLKASLSEENKSMKEDLVEMIQKTSNSEDIQKIQDKLDEIISDPKDTQIVGLNNDEEVLNFYRKHRNLINEILSNLKFYEEKPSDFNCFGLYDYVIAGTKKAVIEVLSKMKEDISKTSKESTAQNSEEV